MARAAYKALKPSNVQVPEGMEITMARRANLLVFKISLRGRIETLISTVEGVLEDLEAALGALEVTSS
jgi:hypothetical protein